MRRKIIIFAGAAKFRQSCILPTAGITNCPWTMEAVTQQLLQPVIQFLIIGRRIQRHSKLAQESGIVNALMRFAIRWDKTGAVDGKNYILPQQIYVVDDLIIGTLQEVE